jgi:hypothetical protein
MLAVPASAAALADSSATSKAADSQASSGAIQARVSSRRIHYGRDVVVTGRAPSSEIGHAVALQFTPAGASSWRAVATSTVRGDGSFRLAAPLRRSGAVRVTSGQQAPSGSTVPLALAASGASTAPSAPERVAVGASLRLAKRAINSTGGQAVNIRGTLLPETGGRRVRLLGLRSGSWQTLAFARTGRHGGFDLRYVPSGVGQQRLRVGFAGDRANGGASKGAGTVTVYQQSLASWYNDGGTTGCGFHAYYGVANVSLPCGTKVNFMYGGRTVTATVDDRGPYVGGRQWDLNQNTAAALGFSGVGSVWASS